MKRFLLLITLVLVFSCNDTGDTLIIEDATTEDLSGVWNITALDHNGKMTVTREGISVPGDYNATGKNIDATMEFKINPNTLIVSGSYTEDYTFTILAQQFSDEIPILLGNSLISGDWSLNKGIITITQDGKSQQAKITELTANTLELEIELNEDIVLSQELEGSLDSILKLTLSR